MLCTNGIIVAVVALPSPSAQCGIKMAREWFKGPIFFGFPIPVYTAIRRQCISVLYHPKLPLAQRCKKGLLPLV